VLAREAEALEELRRCELLAVDQVGGAGAGEDVAHAVAGDVLELAELLVEHRQPHGLPALDPARRGLEGARDQREQRGLARAVRTEHGGPLAGGDAPLDVAQDLAVVERDTHVEQVDDVLAEPGGREPGQLETVAGRGDVLDELVRGVDAELRLGRAGRRASSQPGELLARQVLPLRLGRRGHPVLDVEVVGGLVERDHVPVVDEQRREGDAPTLTAAQGPDPCVPREVGDEPADDVPDLRVACPLVLGSVSHDRVAHDGVVVEGVRLVEDAHPDATAAGDAAGVGQDAAREHPQEGRLAVAVAADDADSVALVDPDRDGVEHDPRRVLQVQGFRPEKMCHRVQG
jgi:hypothetical protein